MVFFTRDRPQSIAIQDGVAIDKMLILKKLHTSKGRSF